MEFSHSHDMAMEFFKCSVLKRIKLLRKNEGEREKAENTVGEACKKIVTCNYLNSFLSIFLHNGSEKFLNGTIERGGLALTNRENDIFLVDFTIHSRKKGSLGNNPIGSLFVVRINWAHIRFWVPLFVTISNSIVIWKGAWMSERERA